jgi:hypothetical protein
MSINSEYNEDIHERVRAILAEHFPNYMFIVMNDSGELFYDFTNLPIGKMLMREVRDELDVDDFDFEWVEEDEDEE